MRTRLDVSGQLERDEGQTSLLPYNLHNVFDINGRDTANPKCTAATVDGKSSGLARRVPSASAAKHNPAAVPSRFPHDTQRSKADASKPGSGQDSAGQGRCRVQGQQRLKSTCTGTATSGPTPSFARGVTAPLVRTPVAKPPPNQSAFETPARHQRPPATQVGATPGPAAAATPIGGAATRPDMPPRTPVTGLRTPARRVPVVVNLSEARAMEALVKDRMVLPAEELGVPGENWFCMEPWKRLLELCTSRQRQAAGANGTTGSPNAAVLIHGPSNLGVDNLGPALATKMGAYYLRLPPDLSRDPALVDGGVEFLRASFRVAGRSTRPFVIHLENVHALLGAAEGCTTAQTGGRMRTELMIAVNELLLPTAHSSSTATAAASGVKVLLLSTSSCPASLDGILASCLGRTACFAAAPDAKERKLHMERWLADASVVVEEEHKKVLVRETEGMSFSELEQLLNLAVTIAEDRQEDAVCSGSNKEVKLEWSDIEEALKDMNRCTGGMPAATQVHACASKTRSSLRAASTPQPSLAPSMILEAPGSPAAAASCDAMRVLATQAPVPSCTAHQGADNEAPTGFSDQTSCSQVQARAGHTACVSLNTSADVDDGNADGQQDDIHHSPDMETESQGTTCTPRTAASTPLSPGCTHSPGVDDQTNPTSDTASRSPQATRPSAAQTPLSPTQELAQAVANANFSPLWLDDPEEEVSPPAAGRWMGGADAQPAECLTPAGQMPAGEGDSPMTARLKSRALASCNRRKALEAMMLQEGFISPSPQQQTWAVPPPRFDDD